MVNRFDDTGCWADNGSLVTYDDYRALEVDDDVFQSGVRRVLNNLTVVPELNANPTAKEAHFADSAICQAIDDLENAFSKRVI